MDFMDGSLRSTWLDWQTQRVAVNILMLKRRPVVSDIPQGSLLGPLMFSSFIGDMDSGIECTLSKFAGNTKLCCVVDMLEGRDTIQMHLGRLEIWACVNLTKFS